MPELPEVETIVRDLQRATRGTSIARVEIIKPDLIEGGTPEEFARCLEQRKLKSVSRRAKNIVFDLGKDRLVVNLGMTGRLLVLDRGAEPPSHIGVRAELSSGKLLVYHDVRRFGRLECVPAKVWAARDAALGYEPLAPELSAEILLDLARRSRVAVKTWLMDQRRIVGVGNIYASEALFRAAIDPRRPAHSLTPQDATRLLQSIRDVLQEAIEFRGTTLLDYRDASGEPGGFSRRLRVYDRAGDPCVTCDGVIKRIVQGGRSTFFCERCQA